MFLILSFKPTWKNRRNLWFKLWWWWLRLKKAQSEKGSGSYIEGKSSALMGGKGAKKILHNRGNTDANYNLYVGSNWQLFCECEVYYGVYWHFWFVLIFYFFFSIHKVLFYKYICLCVCAYIHIHVHVHVYKYMYMNILQILCSIVSLSPASLT